MLITRKFAACILFGFLYTLSGCAPLDIEGFDHQVPLDTSDTTRPEIINMGTSFSEFVSGEVLSIPKSQTGDLALSAIARDNESGIRNLSLITRLTVICSTTDPDGDIYTEISREYNPSPVVFTGAILGSALDQTVNNKGLVVYTLRNEVIAALACPGRSIYNFRGSITARAENFSGIFATRVQDIEMGPDAPTSLVGVPRTVVLTAEEIENSSQCMRTPLQYCLTHKLTDPCDSTSDGIPSDQILNSITAFVDGRSVTAQSYCEGDTVIVVGCDTDGRVAYRPNVPPRLSGCGGTVQYSCQGGLLTLKQDGASILRRVVAGTCSSVQ